MGRLPPDAGAPVGWGTTTRFTAPPRFTRGRHPRRAVEAHSPLARLARTAGDVLRFPFDQYAAAAAGDSMSQEGIGDSNTAAEAQPAGPSEHRVFKTLQTGRRLVLIALVASVCTLLAPAANAQGYVVKLSYKPFLTAAEDSTVVRLAFADERATSRGGAEDTERVGTVRGAVGEPWLARNKGQPADKIAKAYGRDLALAAGLAQGKSDSLPRLKIIFNDLWIDGFVVYKFDISMRFDLERPDGTVLFSEAVTATVTGDGMNIQAMLKDLLSVHAQSALQLLRSPSFLMALDAASAPTNPTPAPAADASEAPPPAAGWGCSKDTDCKGDRICTAHECVSP